MLQNNVRINLNNSVRFKLTKKGRDHVDHLNTTNEVLMKYPYMREEHKDKDGCFTIPLWEFMNIFGDVTYMGMDCMIENNMMEVNLDT